MRYYPRRWYTHGPQSLGLRVKAWGLGYIGFRVQVLRLNCQRFAIRTRDLASCCLSPTPARNFAPRSAVRCTFCRLVGAGDCLRGHRLLWCLTWVSAPFSELCLVVRCTSLGRPIIHLFFTGVIYPTGSGWRVSEFGLAAAYAWATFNHALCRCGCLPLRGGISGHWFQSYRGPAQFVFRPHRGTADSGARDLLRASGTGLAYSSHFDRATLNAHHGSMAPKKDQSGKANKGNKGGGKQAAPPSSSVKFVPPQSVMMALQARAGRAQQAILSNEAAMRSNRTIAQEANFVASQIAKATKRLEANLKAKKELGDAALEWFNVIAEHLPQHLAEAERQGQQLDQDTMEALHLLSAQSSGAHSTATAALLQRAKDGLGQVLPSTCTGLTSRAVHALRNVAASRQDPPLAPALGPSAIIAPTDMPGTSSAWRPPLGPPPGITHNRWSKRAPLPMQEEERPGKSPRMEVHRAPALNPLATQGLAQHVRPGSLERSSMTAEMAPSPWTSLASGLTPTRPQRESAFAASIATAEDVGTSGFEDRQSEPMSFQADETLGEAMDPAEDWTEWANQWREAWNGVTQYLLDLYGRSTTTLRSDPSLRNFHPAEVLEDANRVQHEASATMDLLMKEHPVISGPMLASIVEDVLRTYHAIRDCPAAGSTCPMVLIFLGHVLTAHVPDIHSFAPQVLEELLYPDLVVNMHADRADRLGHTTTATPPQSILQACACPFTAT